MSLDGWSNTNMESIYGYNIITAEERRCYLLAAEDLSGDKHTSEIVAGTVARLSVLMRLLLVNCSACCVMQSLVYDVQSISQLCWTRLALKRSSSWSQTTLPT